MIIKNFISEIQISIKGKGKKYKGKLRVLLYILVNKIE